MTSTYVFHFCIFWYSVRLTSSPTQKLETCDRKMTFSLVSLMMSCTTHAGILLDRRRKGTILYINLGCCLLWVNRVSKFHLNEILRFSYVKHGGGILMMSLSHSDFFFVWLRFLCFNRNSFLWGKIWIVLLICRDTR